MISEGIDINFAYNDSDTLLILSIRYKRTKIAQWLIENGADINKPTLQINPFITCY